MSNFKDNSGLDVIKPKMTKEDSDLLMKKFLEKVVRFKRQNQVILKMQMD